MRLKKLAVLSMVGIMSLGFMSTNALAADDTSKSGTSNVNVNVQSGGLHLNIPQIENFQDVTITANKETYKTGFNKSGLTEGSIRVSDLRGTAAGWSVKVSATQFQNEKGHKLPAGSITLDGVRAIPALDGTVNNMPTSKLNQTQTIDNGSVLIATALPQNGLGVYDIQFNEKPIGLIVDAKSALVGTYTSTLTWNLESTPTIN